MFFDINLEKGINDGDTQKFKEKVFPVALEGISPEVVANTVGLDIKPTQPLMDACSNLFKIEYAHEDPFAVRKNTHPVRIEWITRWLGEFTHILYVNDKTYDLREIKSEDFEDFVMSKLKENGIKDLAFDDIHKVTILG